MKLDILLETVRKLLGRQRLLESMIQQHAKTWGPVAFQLPRNPLDHHLRSAAEFRHLNVQLQDKSFRQELTSFLTCLGGQNIDEFVKRIFLRSVRRGDQPLRQFQKQEDVREPLRF
nr:unnamed protein product [Spirometra erinaceieuropaei]